MPATTKFLPVVLLTLLLSACGVLGEPPFSGSSAALQNLPGRGVAATPAACHAALETLAADESSGDASPASLFSLLVWNIKKGSDSSWHEDLSRWSGDSDLILLQEALAPGARPSMSADHGAAAFAPGYARGALQTGVATLSDERSSIQCQLRSREPWLRTPKATLLTRYDLGDPGQSLLVLNTHMINFTLGTRAYRRQLAVIEGLVEAHEGPVIVAGDFNTWNDRRQQALDEFAARSQLSLVPFADDQRTRFMGKPLDHVLVGGATIQEARSLVVDSSDHNPIWVSLRLTF